MPAGDKHLNPHLHIQEMNMANYQWDDCFQLDQQLTEDERMIRDAARSYCQDKLKPRVQPCSATSPWTQHLPRDGRTGPGPHHPHDRIRRCLNYVSYGLVAREIERVDGLPLHGLGAILPGDGAHQRVRHRSRRRNTCPSWLRASSSAASA
jgi:hypothetical protein